MLLLLLHAVEGNSLIANCSALCTDDSATYQPDDGSASVTRVSMMSSLPYDGADDRKNLTTRDPGSR